MKRDENIDNQASLYCYKKSRWCSSIDHSSFIIVAIINVDKAIEAWLTCKRVGVKCRESRVEVLATTFIHIKK